MNENTAKITTNKKKQKKKKTIKKKKKHKKTNSIFGILLNKMRIINTKKTHITKYVNNTTS
jgi:hypothetical protein